ncbi:acylneuraminate cytidylyltransferase [filamentous cyanobacterium CCP5]|nr:acylneuraminate cytidylyltransferase [filamentous cyanobacterium CCP5]
MTVTPTIVALVPARAGSKRVPGKNVRLFAGHPLIAYTISAAIQSRIFSAVIVSTDSEEIAEIARHYGAEVPFLRPVEYAADLSPDFEWIDYSLRRLRQTGRGFEAFSILRPTSPFRQPETIQRAWKTFLTHSQADSLRAVEKCGQHPGKMWVINGDFMEPLLPNGPQDLPWHSQPYQALPLVYAQNASLEMAWSRVVFDQKTIAGEIIMPFLTEGFEGFDINTPADWWYGEYSLNQRDAQLPSVPQSPIILTAN